MNGLANYFKEHLSQILTGIVTIIVAWTLLNRDVQELKLHVAEIKATQEYSSACQGDIKERLIRLETQEIDIQKNLVKLETKIDGLYDK